MKSKTLVAAIILVITAALIFVGPTSYGAAKAKLEETKLAETRKNTYTGNLNTMERAVLSAVSEYNDTREFDIFYGDVEHINKIFVGLSGVEVQSITVVDPMDYYRDIMAWSEGTECSAVKFDLLVVDPDVAINAITRMELPVQRLSVVYPSTVQVVFMTGGAV